MTGLEIVGALATVAGGITSAVGSMASAQAQSDAADAAARTADYNRQIAERNAKIARNQAEVDAADQEAKNRRQMGMIRASYGASGMDLAGSPLDVLQDTATEQALDVEKVKYTGELKAIGEVDRAKQFAAERDNYLASKSSYKTAGMIGAASSIFGSIGSAGNSLARMK